MRSIIIQSEGSLPDGEDIVRFIRAQRSQKTRKVVSFNRYPSEMAFMRYEEQEALSRKLLLERTNSNRNENLSRTAMTRLSFKDKPTSSQINRLNPPGTHPKVSRLQPNPNIQRVTREVGSSLRQLPRSQPFKVLRSLSLKTLRNKAQVQQERKLMERLQQRNPFAPRYLETEYLE